MSLYAPPLTAAAAETAVSLLHATVVSFGGDCWCVSTVPLFSCRSVVPCTCFVSGARNSSLCSNQRALGLRVVSFGLSPQEHGCEGRADGWLFEFDWLGFAGEHNALIPSQRWEHVLVLASAASLSPFSHSRRILRCVPFCLPHPVLPRCPVRSPFLRMSINSLSHNQLAAECLEHWRLPRAQSRGCPLEDKA